MNKEQFIIDHIESIKNYILTKKLPDNWQGLELKQYIADKFQGDLKHYFTRKRKSNYNNDIVINNL